MKITFVKEAAAVYSRKIAEANTTYLKEVNRIEAEYYEAIAELEQQFGSAEMFKSDLKAARDSEMRAAADARLESTYAANKAYHALANRK